jgi:hypothetical protein
VPFDIGATEPSAAATEFTADRITYNISFSTHSIASAGEARSQFITQLYKRARPVVDQRKSVGGETARDSLLSRPIFLFGENELFNHLSLLETLSDAEKTDLNGQFPSRHFQEGEELLTHGKATKSIHFVFSGIIQVTRQVQDGRVLNVRKVGPGDSFGGISLLTGMPSSETLTAATLGLLLELHSENLKPILQSRPELAESLAICLLSYNIVSRHLTVL